MAPFPSDGAPMGPPWASPGLSGPGGLPGRVDYPDAAAPSAAPGHGTQGRAASEMRRPLRPAADASSETPRLGSFHTKALSRIRQFEGPRGHSVRATIWLRYVLYLAVILGCSLSSQALLSGLPEVGNGGDWMFYSVVIILASAAAGAVFYTNHRNEIVNQARHFVFGIVVFPGTGLAILMRLLDGVTGSITSSQSFLSSTMADALPLVFFCTIVLPCLIFIKLVAGMRHLHRSRLDDEEAVRLWTRQDGYQR